MVTGLKQPVGQKRLTNIAIVKLKSHGKHFEIACYKNKVLNWREGIERDLNEVIQTDTIFTNVGKGIVAKEEDLTRAFGTSDKEEICKRILKKGDFQVSDKERQVHLDGMFRDIVQLVVQRCVQPQDGRQHTPLAVENALRQTGFIVQSGRSAKPQALEASSALVSTFPESFARAKMRLRLACPVELRTEILQFLETEAEARVDSVESVVTEAAENLTMTFVCEPGHYRKLDELCTKTHHGKGLQLSLLEQTVLEEAAPPRAPEAAPAPASEAPAKKRALRCSGCAVEFSDPAEYRSHCRSDWHNHNLKRKVRGLPPLPEEDFAEVSLDEREGFLAVQS